MSDQVVLSEFEAPVEKERGAYKEILPDLQAAVSDIGADPKQIKFKSGKNYSSVFYGSVLCFRLRLRSGTRYIELPQSAMDCVADNFPENLLQRQGKDGSFWRLDLGDSPFAEYSDMLCKTVISTINRLPKEWDCCSRYMECSNAKKCVHPDKSFALGCGYRKILAPGRVFYGENRNVD